jgi:hypothetical protein
MNIFETNRRLEGGVNPMKSKRNSSKPLLKVSGSSPSTDTEEKGFNLLDKWENMHNFTNTLSKKTNEMDDLLKALHLLSSATEDKNMLKNVISSLAKLNREQAQKKVAPEKLKSESAPVLSGDTLYDLLNSPALTNLTKEVMKKKKGK